jgi:hypothetical protein
MKYDSDSSLSWLVNKYVKYKDICNEYTAGFLINNLREYSVELFLPIFYTGEYKDCIIYNVEQSQYPFSPNVILRYTVKMITTGNKCSVIFGKWLVRFFISCGAYKTDIELYYRERY